MLCQIEKLQKMVNGLLGLCREGGINPQNDGTPGGFSERKCEKLGVFILNSQDGVLSRRSAKKMQKWLERDEQARRYYIEFTNLTFLLYLYFQPNKFMSSLEGEYCL